MPQARRYFASRFGELSSIAEGHWQDKEVLGAIYEELGYRKGQTAVTLRASIAEQLRNGGSQNAHAQDTPRKATDGADSTRKNKDELQSALTTSRDRVALQMQLRGALDTLERQEVELKYASGWIAQLKRYHEYGPEVFAIFAEACLTPDCPDAIVKAVRKAYRKEYHPDTKPEHEKRNAEEKFKRIDAVFDRIERVRIRSNR